MRIQAAAVKDSERFGQIAFTKKHDSKIATEDLASFTMSCNPQAVITPETLRASVPHATARNEQPTCYPAYSSTWIISQKFRITRLTHLVAATILHLDLNRSSYHYDY